MSKKIFYMKNITKNFNKLKVLKDTSFYLNKGEIISLLGPSGSGKSTIFRMLAGLEQPDSGQLYINPDIRKGYVFQEERLLPWKTVEDNIHFVQKRYLNTDEAELKRKTLLKLTGLYKFRDSYPAQLSGGMKQRIEIIRALSIKPELLLLDEPFKSLDAQTGFNIKNMILRFNEMSGLSTFLITHDPEEAVLMADRIYILSRKPGKILKSFKIKIPQAERSIKDDQIYSIRQEIIETFTDLVNEFDWKKSEETDNIIKQFKT